MCYGALVAAATLVGIDENGLGPRLGPLIVTAVTAEAADEKAAKVLLGRPGRAFGARIGDSKALVSYKDGALGQAWARVLGETTGVSASSPRDLVAGLALEAETSLQAQCPGAHKAQCWSSDGEVFDAPADLVANVRKDLARLERRGARVHSVRVAIVCTRRINEAAHAGTSRFQVDLHTMERLVLDARSRAPEDVVAVCGKVGVGRVAFVRDADEQHLLVCLASLVGKYVRDLLTARVVRHHGRELPHLPLVSGYHDPVTARFVEDTADSRRATDFPMDCFERRAAT
jgi:ribonuclease HII